MPNREEHCKHTMERYGVTGEDIHEWMDEPSLLLGPEHRGERHDPQQSLPQIFVNKYGSELARNIMLDHIFLDAKSVGGRVPRQVLGNWMKVAKASMPPRLNPKFPERAKTWKIKIAFFESPRVGKKVIAKVQYLGGLTTNLIEKNYYAWEITPNVARLIEEEIKEGEDIVGTEWYIHYTWRGKPVPERVERI